MGSHSEHAAYVRGMASTVLGSGEPVDSGAVRDAVINNLNHLHDEHGQVVAALNFPSGTWAAAGAAEAPSRPQRVYVLDCIFPLHVRESDGDSFRVVPYLRVELVDPSSDVVLDLWLTPTADDPPLPPLWSSSNPMTRRITVSAGAAHTEEPDAMYIPASVLRDRGFDGFARLTVWASWTATDAEAAVYLMNLREFVGP